METNDMPISKLLSMANTFQKDVYELNFWHQLQLTECFLVSLVQMLKSFE
jgi:hypothetical protein